MSLIDRAQGLVSSIVHRGSAKPINAEFGGHHVETARSVKPASGDKHGFASGLRAAAGKIGSGLKSLFTSSSDRAIKALCIEDDNDDGKSAVPEKRAAKAKAKAEMQNTLGEAFGVTFHNNVTSRK